MQLPLTLSSNTQSITSYSWTAKHDLPWLASLVIVYLLFWVPVLDVHPALSTGDNGRDLYAFWMTLQGKWPCRDYWWQYGPLMPLYYAFWFLLGGINLISVRMGLAVSYFLCSFFAYRTLRLLTSPAVAFLSSLAFLSFDMGWSYNHMGTFPFLFFAIFCLWRFFFTHQVRWGYFGTLALAGMALVKSNIGVTSLAAFWVLLLLHQGFLKFRTPQGTLPWKHFIFIPLIFGVVTLGVYALTFWGLPFDQIDHCLTLRPSYHRWSDQTSNSLKYWINFKHLILRFLVWEPRRLLGLGTVSFLSVLALWGLRQRRLGEREKEILLMVVGSLFFFGLVNALDYFLVDGLIYRFDFWFFPILVLWVGLMAEWAGSLFGRGQKKILAGLLFFLLIWFPFRNMKEALAWKIPVRYWDFPHGQVYIGGPLVAVQAIKEVTYFILEKTRPDQEIFAIPYDPLYCFLSGRRQAVRELHITRFVSPSGEQEQALIQELEAKQTPYIILSSRYRSKEIGDFGITHVKKLARYISENYRGIKTFGSWKVNRSSPPMAVKVLQRGDRGEKLDLLT